MPSDYRRPDDEKEKKEEKVEQNGADGGKDEKKEDGFGTVAEGAGGMWLWVARGD
jgi:hypothetical protein